MDNTEPDVNKISQDAIKAIVGMVRSSNSLPLAGEDFNYYQSFKGVRQVLSIEQAKINKMVMGLLCQSSTNADFAKAQSENEMTECVIEANDELLERVGTFLDEITAPKKTEPIMTQVTSERAADINASWNKQTSAKPRLSLFTVKNTERPQLSFIERVDNSNNPFIPIIKDKPNSIRPLAIFLEETPLGVGYCHPYETELDKFEPSADQMKVTEPEVPPPYSDTPLIQVNELAQLEKMVADLREQKEFAVDLEHHSYRSFQGFTCLIQISTRRTDYVVDALKLRSDLHLLNEVFSDPKIVKVFHGADSDVEWLQRDFGVYVVNMFDTGQASRLLSLPHFSLAFLLKLYCDVDAKKYYQLADWRIRPLPTELLTYAREDTHYLLYIYDKMKKDLLDAANGSDNMIKTCFSRSTVVCGRRYEKPLYSDSIFDDFYRKNKRVFNNKQMFALGEIFKWRDRIAREYDESTGYILPNLMLFKISELLPREQQGILAICSPLPPLVKQYQTDLHRIIMKAREVTAENAPHIVAIRVAKTENILDLDHMIVPRHDLKNFHDHSHSLLDSDDETDMELDSTSTSITIKQMANLTVFDDKSERSKNNEKQKQEAFASPYQRFLKMLSFEKVYKTAETKEVTDGDRIQRLQNFLKNLSQNNEPTETEEIRLDEDDDEEEEVTVLEQKLGVSEQMKKRGEKRKATEPIQEVTIEDDDVLAPRVTNNSVPNLSKKAKQLKKETPKVEEGRMRIGAEDEVLLEPPTLEKNGGQLTKSQKKRRSRKRAEINKNMNFSDIKPFDYAGASTAPVKDESQDTPQNMNKKQRKRQFNPYQPICKEFDKNKTKRFTVTQNKRTDFMFNPEQNKPGAASTSSNNDQKPNWPQRNKQQRRH